MKDNKTSLLTAKYPKPDSYGALNMPVYNNAAFEFGSAAEMEDAFTGKVPAPTYSRIVNPTVDYFECRVKAITKAQTVTAVASGMAAIANTFITLTKCGSNIISSTHLFGNTFSLLHSTLADFGVEARFCNTLNPQEVDKAIDKNTACVFVEVVTNPHLEVADLNALASVCKKYGVPLVADTTLVAWGDFAPANHNIDIEIVSSTKYISGGATSLGGLIIDYGNFDWSKSEKLSKLTPKAGISAFSAKLRGEVFRNIGGCMSPQSAHIQTTGLETLTLRYNAASNSALKIAGYLANNSKVKSVSYPGLSVDKYHEIFVSQFGQNAGAVLAFELESKEQCFKFIDKVQIIRRATNIADNRSLIIHPLSTIYGTMSPEIQAKIGVSNNMLRLSVGLEDVNDLLEDIEQALK